MQKGIPFSRSRALFTMIAAAMRLGPLEQKAALASLAPYKSRGKGRGAPSRKFGNKVGKYTPHQGRREMARRVRQMEARHGR